MKTISIYSTIIKSGDIVQLVSGTFKVLETKIIEIKQGPYIEKMIKKDLILLKMIKLIS